MRELGIVDCPFMIADDLFRAFLSVLIVIWRPGND
jgi:hypothetical protein